MTDSFPLITLLAKEDYMRGRVCTLVVLLLFSSVILSAAESPKGEKPDSNTSITLMLKKAGLENLSKEDQERVIGLLSDAVASIRRTDKRTTDIADRAEKYFEAEGYKVLYLKVVTVHGENWLVVSTGLTTSATKDLPLLFPSLLFKEGYYFCKTAIMGGITEMIDDSGRKQSFFMAEWKDLR